MPFPRKKLKLVNFDEDGRKKTKFVASGASDTEKRHEEACETGKEQSRTGPPIRPSSSTVGDNVDVDDDLDFTNQDAGFIGSNERRNNRRSYSDIKRADCDRWEHLRESLFRTAVSMECPPDEAVCQICSIKLMDTDTHRCVDCGPLYVVCHDCLQSDHCLRPNHCPEKWNGKFYEAVPPYFNFAKPLGANLCYCFTTYRRNLKIVDLKGRVHDCTIQFCQCCPEPVTLLKLGLWSSSSLRPSTAYDIHLLRLLVALMLECHVSVLGFVNALRWKNDLSKFQANSLYRLLVNESFEEYRHFVYELESLQKICCDIGDGADCLLCSKGRGDCILMLDGTFGCVRKGSSGTSLKPPKHSNRFFLDQDKVDNFLKGYSDEIKEISLDCSSFKAGSDKLRNSIHNNGLDITGVFGSVCKHEVPGRFMNMKHGERLAYPVFLVQSYLKDYSDRKFGVIYDISCLLSKHIKKNKMDEEFKRCTFVTPDWHAYGHVAACQIVYAIRYYPEFGLTDGEGMERLWSYLRQFTAITKEMTPSHRTDLLTDGLIHFAKRKNKSMTWTLAERLSKSETVLKSSQDELCTILESFDGSITEADIHAWHDKEKSLVLAKKTSKKRASDWTTAYVAKLLDLTAARNLYKECTTTDDMVHVKKHMKGLDKELKVIERKNAVESRWKSDSVDFQDSLTKLEDEQKVGILSKARSEAVERIFHLSLKKKYSAGQSIPKQIEKQIKRINERLTATVRKYNDSCFTSESSLPNAVTFSDVKDPEAEIYDKINEEIEVPTFLPPSMKKKILALLFLRERAIAEKQQVTFDTEMLLQSLAESSEKLNATIGDFEQARMYVDGRCAYSIGSVALLHIAAKRIDTTLDEARILLQVEECNDGSRSSQNAENALDETEAAYDAEIDLLDEQEEYAEIPS